MIGLARNRNYDVAVLVSSWRDFVPILEYLNHRGIKTVQAAFPYLEAQLTQAY